MEIKDIDIVENTSTKNHFNRSDFLIKMDTLCSDLVNCITKLLRSRYVVLLHFENNKHNQALENFESDNPEYIFEVLDQPKMVELFINLKVIPTGRIFVRSIINGYKQNIKLLNDNFKNIDDLTFGTIIAFINFMSKPGKVNPLGILLLVECNEDISNLTNKNIWGDDITPNIDGLLEWATDVNDQYIIDFVKCSQYKLK